MKRLRTIGTFPEFRPPGTSALRSDRSNAISAPTPLNVFGATYWDITPRRQFRLTEKLGLQSHADFFHILNHPNFSSPINYLTSPQFGQPTQMLNKYLGSGGLNGGLNPLYEIGGPRSIQLALKLHF